VLKDNVFFCDVSLYATENRTFAKTGSGQTQGKLNETGTFFWFSQTPGMRRFVPRPGMEVLVAAVKIMRRHRWLLQRPPHC
jgi:hypothetical protein